VKSHTSSVTRGDAIFGVVYLPVPVIDAYFKVGLARLESQVSGLSLNYPVCKTGIACPLFVRLLPYNDDSEQQHHVSAGATHARRLGYQE